MPSTGSPARSRWVGAAVAVMAACAFDPSYRDEATPLVATCEPGALQCRERKLERCVGDQAAQVWAVADDCRARDEVCVLPLGACRPCAPGQRRCDGQTVLTCTPAGDGWTRANTECDTANGTACREGTCVHLCRRAEEDRSNVGCEYWAVDLDNAVISASLNAASQQFAVVVSNAQPDVVADVIVEEDVSAVGSPTVTRKVAEARIPPNALEVFKLGPKEVDGSPPGSFDVGPGTAHTRNAYRVTSTVPVVAYQFNPLENVNVFSNDASLLLPQPALNRGGDRAYVVASWPQTIASTDDPATNFGSNLRAFLTIVGTRANTQVRVKTRARIVPGAPLLAGVPAGGELTFELQPFEVLNLETGDFNADFTGSLIDANQPVAVFAGSEASDAPMFGNLAGRACCADHLETQLPPARAVGRSYVLARMPNRSRAVARAGGLIDAVDEPEYFRVVAARAGATKVTTSLPAPDDAFTLEGEGAARTLTVRQDFTLLADKPALVADVQASQEAAGVPRGLPGGDPSLLIVPPVEQWRSDYVLLTPDKYSFDFLVVMAPAEAKLFVDGLAVDASVCEVAPVGPRHVVYRCQLSFPVIDPQKAAPLNVTPGRQNDGVHRVQADLPVGVIAYGFDGFVSYAYAGGTQLTDVILR